MKFPYTIFNLVGFLFFSIYLQGAPTYLEVKAIAGDGIYSLMRRYQLDRNSCNFTEFYRLNALKKNAALRVGRAYQLPIQVHTYNGKSIRSTIGISDWNQAVSIKEYNEAMEAAGLRSDPYHLGDKILWVPHHLLHCPTTNLVITPPMAASPEEAPSTGSSGSGNRRFPIFGETYAYTPLISKKLSGKVYYIVGGHGGPDPGAIGRRGRYNLCEDEYAYDVALRLCRNLVSHGATAYMINRDLNDGIRDDEILVCDRDEVLWGNIKQHRGQKARLTQRSDVINDLFAKHLLQGVTEQYVVTIHVDSRNQSERTDVFFYHYPNSKEGKSLANKLHRQLKQKYNQYQKARGYHGTVTARDLHMLREPKPTGVYVELANIRNQSDQRRIVVKRNRQLLADWLMQGIMNW